MLMHKVYKSKSYNYIQENAELVGRSSAFAGWDGESWLCKGNL